MTNVAAGKIVDDGVVLTAADVTALPARLTTDRTMRTSPTTPKEPTPGAPFCISATRSMRTRSSAKWILSLLWPPRPWGLSS
jgi:hypothetical protein